MHPHSNATRTKVIAGRRFQRTTPKRVLVSLLLTAAVILLLGPAGCKYAGDMEAADSSGEKQMKPHDSAAIRESADRPGIPPIDRDVPENYQTATFALG